MVLHWCAKVSSDVLIGLPELTIRRSAGRQSYEPLCSAAEAMRPRRRG